MATVRQYVTQMRGTMNTVATQMGVDVTRTDKQARVTVTCLLAIIAVVVKTLVDKGVISNAELQATLDGAVGEVWPPESDLPPL